MRPVWAEYFNLNAVETRARRFDMRILTDGCGVSIQMNRSQPAHAALPVPDPGHLRALLDMGAIGDVRGVDPGITDVVTVASRAALDEPATYSGARYYERAKFNLSRRRAAKWNAETADLTAGAPPGRAPGVERQLLYVAFLLAHGRDLLRHRLKYRNLRFLRHMHKDAAIEEICDLVAGSRDRPVVVGFGSWAGPNGTPIRRRTAGPLQEIRRRLARRPNVHILEVNETRSSCVCWGCHSRLTNMRALTTPRDGTLTQDKRKIHKVLHCKQNAVKPAYGWRCGTTWNRDVNGSRNILLFTMCFIHERQRPAAFLEALRR